MLQQVDAVDQLVCLSVSTTQYRLTALRYSHLAALARDIDDPSHLRLRLQAGRHPSCNEGDLGSGCWRRVVGSSIVTWGLLLLHRERGRVRIAQVIKQILVFETMVVLNVPQQPVEV